MLPLSYTLSVATIFGLCLGSFLNVVAYRLPVGQSLVSPGSACPGCGTAIRPYDNLPVISWLALRGHCRECDTEISARYPLTEAATGALFAAVVLLKHDSRLVWLDLCFVAALVAITRIDLEHFIIPNRIVAALAIVAIALLALLTPRLLVSHLIAGAAAGGALGLLALALPRGMGMGDAKLLGVMGLVLGWAVVPALLIGLVAGSLVGAILAARQGVSVARRTKVPFGPFLAVGGIVAMFAGQALVNAYLHGVGL